MRRRRATPKSGRPACSRAAAVRRLLLLAPIIMVAYAMVARWRAASKNRRGGGGAIASASGRACFGHPDERTRSRQGGGGKGGAGLEHIAHAYLLPPGRLVGGLCGGHKVVAFAITLTKDGGLHMDGAAVLAASIDNACATSEFLCDLVAFVHDEVGLQSENILTRLGFRVLRPGLPLSLDDIEHEGTRNRVRDGGCCGPAELMKLYAYTLVEYHRVVHLDTDALVLQALDPLLDAEESLLYTADINMSNDRSPTMPVQGGFLVVRPDLSVFRDLIQVATSTPFTPQGWGGSNIGLFWGGITVQGLLPYFYEHRAAPGVNYRAVDRCVYNNMVDRPDCQMMDVSSVRSAHFTNCQKPWSCIYPHPKQPLCSLLMERWFDMRERAERALELPPSKACPKGFRGGYSPMPLLLEA